MVEGKLGNLGYRKPARIRGVGRSLGLMLGQLYQRIIGNAHDPLTRVAVQLPKGIKLFQEDIRQACLLVEFAASGGIQSLVNPNETTGQRPSSFERFQAALNQQKFQLALTKAEDDAVHGQSGSGILISMG